ncbi:MAG: DMT family transporter [Candidatus Handelsmanbacteria bacterium]|nr:DMT family transporter [Candidatus Handelsmanbacteria bacterium]
MPFTEPLSALTQVPLRVWALLGISLDIGMVVGDTLYLTAIREIGVSRALSLVCTCPLLIMVLERLLLAHPFRSGLVLGACLVAGGVILLAARGGQVAGAGRPPRLKYGAAMALGAAGAWGLSIICLSPALVYLTPVQANAIRLPLVSLLVHFTQVHHGRQEERLDRRTGLIIALSGLVGMGIAAFAFLGALRLIGPAKTATLGSTSPVFGVVLSMLFLKEQVNLRLVAGIAACMGGVWLVI